MERMVSQGAIGTLFALPSEPNCRKKASPISLLTRLAEGMARNGVKEWGQVSRYSIL